jgi:hypothetical protein
VGLKPLVAAKRQWERRTADVSAFETRLALAPRGLSLRLVIYQNRVAHKTQKNFPP